MKKIFYNLILFTFSFSIISCGSDDNADSDAIFEFVDSSWRGTGETTSDRMILINSATTMVFEDDGNGVRNGTYTFDNEDLEGQFFLQSGSVPFFIEGDMLNVNYNEGTGAFIDTDGIATYIKQ